MNPNDIAVHIKTQEEAREVVAWFESFGFRRTALNPHNYLDYPFFHIARYDGKLLTGVTNADCLSNYTLMEYEEWEDLIHADDSTDDPIDEEEFIRLVMV